MSDIELCVLTPSRWFVNGRWRKVQPPDSASYTFHSMKVVLPHVPRANWYLHRYPGLPALLRDFRPDIINLWEEPWSLVSAEIGWLRDRMLPKTRILMETEQNIYRTLPHPFRWFQRRTLDAADAAIARSQEAAQVLRRKGYAGPVKVIPNGVDSSLFRPMNRESCRQQWEVAGFVVGYIGRIVACKGVLDLLEALAFCPTDVNLLYIGEGPDVKALKEKVRKFGLKSRVRFLPHQEQSVLPEIMNALDALVLPSRTTPTWKEQFGRVLIEAQACAVPTIGSDSGAIPEVVGHAGLIVPEGDVKALANAIRCLYDTPGLRQELGCQGCAQVEAYCTWERVAAQMHTLYREMLNTKKQNSRQPL